jgi:hypothetical protein
VHWEHTRVYVVTFRTRTVSHIDHVPCTFASVLILVACNDYRSSNLDHNWIWFYIVLCPVPSNLIVSGPVANMLMHLWPVVIKAPGSMPAALPGGNKR